MATIIEGKDRIDLARLLVLRRAVHLEALGMTRHGRSATAIAREELGIGRGARRERVQLALDDKIARAWRNLGTER